MTSRIIVALDHASPDEAMALVDALGPQAGFYKVGLELYVRGGPTVVRALRARGKRVFLDLKLHDIPNTVARAVEAAAELEVDFLTVHCAGGSAMLRAAREAARDQVELLGVTVLTSLEPREVAEAWGRGAVDAADEVSRLAGLAHAAGVHGVIASPLEAERVRRSFGPDFRIVTPGIRPAGADAGDQARVATPTLALRSGADYLVVGRPIHQASDPAAAFAAIQDEAFAALAS